MATGNKPPGQIKAKGDFLAQDLYRTALQGGIPFLETPSNFFDGAFQRKIIGVQRVLCAAEMHNAVDNQQHLRLALAFSNALHAEKALRDGSELHLNEALMQAALERSGLEPQTVLELAITDAVKDRLKANTEEAVARGAFGSPTLIVTEQADGAPPFAPPGGGGALASLGADGEFLVFGSDRMEQVAHFLELPYYGPNPGKYKALGSMNAP